MQAALFPQELSPENVLSTLSTRCGAANGITARDLAYVLTGRINPADERKLRQAIEHLRMQGHAICAHPSLGYFMAANDSDLDHECEFLYGRALTSLRQISAMKKIAMPNLRGQLGLPLTGEDDERT